VILGITLALVGPIAGLFVFFSARRRKVPSAFATVAGLDVFCGLENLLPGGAHLTSVLGQALSGKAPEGGAPFTYDFRFYSLVLLGVLLVVLGMPCLLAARGLARGDASGWRMAFWSSLSLLVINAPLVTIQDFARGLGGAALANLIGLAATRKRFLS